MEVWYKNKKMMKMLSLWWNAEKGAEHCIVSEEPQIKQRRWFDTTGATIARHVASRL
jgi:hypothetical protein